MDPLFILLVGIAVVVGGILWLRLHAFLALLAGAFIVAALTGPAQLERFASEQEMSAEAATEFVDQSVGTRVASGLGATAGEIGILIAMAAIIGKCLLESGAADRIVRSTLKLFGEPRAPLGLMSSGFVLGIPVFFDTVFYLLIPLGKAMGLRTGKNYGLYVLAIVAGATMAHSLVPPTPGPLFVANALNVEVGQMMLGGLVVGLCTCSAGYLYARWANRRWPIPLRDTADLSHADLEALAQKPESELPPLWLSLLPILLPVVLIAGDSVLKFIYSDTSAGSMSGMQQLVLGWFDNLGDKNIALVLGAAIALGTLVWKKQMKRDQLSPALQSALASGGVIILITAAGGAFGEVLKQTGIGGRIEQLATTYQLAVLPLAFGVTALVRTAQGSATVAMITAVGILSQLADAAQLGFHPVYIALAIGCGSKPFSWMNDSGFWVVGRMSGMTEGETLRSFSMMLLLMGAVGLVVTMVLARLVPLV